MLEQIAEHLEIWSAAQAAPVANGGRGRGRGANGQSPHGIKKLRELILELAVRGKLVPQDTNEEPASFLLEKIAKEKDKLIKEGKIKKQKSLSKIGEEEKPFSLPIGWVWQRLGDVGYTQTGGTPSKTNKSFFGEDIPFIKPGDIYPTLVDYSNEGLSLEGQKALGRTAPRGSILMVCIGTIGKCNSIDRDCSFNQQINSLSPYADITAFLLASLRSNYFQTTAWQKSSSTTIAILNKGKWADIVVPLPPLAEQHRIVAKVDELMALCDKLEQQQTDSNETHRTLVETLLATLTISTDQAEFALSWRRIAAHFDTLLTTEESLDQLKQTILQLAVMGKLVEQDSNDEPASVLLEKIAKEKAKLIKEGKIKKQNPLPKISDDEKPFELPGGWEWARLDDLALRSEAGWSPKCEATPREDNNWGVLKVSAVTWGQYKPGENKALPSSLDPRPEYEVQPNDFLISRANTADLVARAVVVPKDAPPRLMMSDKIIRFVFPPSGNTEFINLANRSSFSREYYSRVAGGTSSSMKNVSRDQIRMLLIALPPSGEQHRIVTKVDELMALCDTLKARLHDAQTTQIQLADAIVEQAVAA